MSEKTKFRLMDIFLLCGAVLPVFGGILLKILTATPSEEINVTGATVFFTVPMPLMDFPVTEAQVNSWIVILSLFFLSLYLTHGISEKPHTKRQLVAEWIVEQTESLVRTNMGAYFHAYTPFICAILGLSAFSSLLSLCGLFPPTSDLNVVAGWAILVFLLITHYKMKCGIRHYLKSFLEPVPFLLPLNIIGEIATPISMAFRHYGNILSGTVISILIAAALGGLSKLVLGWLPGVLGEIPFLRIGLPAILSIYFDVFSGCLQAFIFALLTMLYIAGAFALDDYKKLHPELKIGEK